MKKLLIISCVLFIGVANIYGQSIEGAYEKLAYEKYTQALQDFNAILSKNKNCIECLYGRAKAKYFLKNYKSALVDCEASLKDTTDIQYNYSLLGVITEL